MYMSFMLRNGWHCQFLEPDLKTPQPKKLTFNDERKIRELAEQGRAFARRRSAKRRRRVKGVLFDWPVNGRSGEQLQIQSLQVCTLRVQLRFRYKPREPSSSNSRMTVGSSAIVSTPCPSDALSANCQKRYCSATSRSRRIHRDIKSSIRVATLRRGRSSLPGPSRK